MNRFMIYGYLWLIMLSFEFSKNIEQPSGQASLTFRHYVGNNVLEVGKTYTNVLGEDFSISKFRYYVSNIGFADSLNKTIYLKKNACFLINETDAGSKSFELAIPAGTYNKLSFLIGIDSIRNVSGAQQGALDPLNDMFWTWRSGYVMAKMEGEANVSSLPHHIFEYHIGGFKGKYNVLQQVELALPATVVVLPGKSLQINIAVDLNAWFGGTHSLSIAQYPACTSEGVLAQQFSENYRTMFSVQMVTLQ
ncbi:MAG: hypothetical protein QM802_24900 [Agriterribacter sp.]